MAEIPKPYFVPSHSKTLSSKVKSMLRHCAGSQCPHNGALNKLKMQAPKGISFLGQWYCGVECVRAPLEQGFARLSEPSFVSERKSHRLPIGLFLVSKGVITAKQLDEALRLQRENEPRRLGYWLRRTGAIKDQELAAALAVQWACPIFPLDGHSEYLHCAQFMPLALMESEQILPVHYSRETNVVYIALADRVDHAMMLAIEKILGCRTAPCVVLEGPLTEAIGKVRAASSSTDLIVEERLESTGMFRVAFGEIQSRQPAEVRIQRAGSYIWTRLLRDEQASDVLFRIRTPKSKVLTAASAPQSAFETSLL